MSFGELVKTYRHKANLTLSELAERTGVSRSVLARIESGETKRPAFSTCKTIASVLQIPPAQVIVFYLDISQRTDTLKKLLREAIAHANKHIVRKAAVKLLETSKGNTYLALDTLFQTAAETEDPDIKLTLYNVMIDFTKRRGIPYYLARCLFEKYLIERYDFARLEDTYRRGKELLSYIEYLQPAERAVAYYRLGLQAYALKYFDECIHLCRQGIHEDRTDSELKASALLAISNAYINLEDLVLAELYLKEYEQSPYAKQVHSRYLKAQLYAKRKEYDRAIAAFASCLEEADQDARIAIAVDLMEVCLQVGDADTVKRLIRSQAELLPVDMNTPKKIEHVALYYRRKGEFELANHMYHEGMDSLLQSMGYYRQIGAFADVTACMGAVLHYHNQHGRLLEKEYMEKMEHLCNNRGNAELSQGRSRM